MLVLSRKKGESIILKADEHVIELLITRAGKGVSIGITAPKEVSILRGELKERKVEE